MAEFFFHTCYEYMRGIQHFSHQQQIHQLVLEKGTSV